MTHFVQNDDYYYKDNRGSVINCTNCSEPSQYVNSTNPTIRNRVYLLYELITVPMEYSCEFLNRGGGYIPTDFTCDTDIETIGSRLANCKTDYCVNGGGYRLSSNIGTYPNIFFSTYSYQTFDRTGDLTFNNVPNLTNQCSNNYHKITQGIFDSTLDYDFEIILQTFEIDMELYKPGYSCVESSNETSDQFFAPLVRPDFQYRNISCHTPDVPCEGRQSWWSSTDSYAKNQGACSKINNGNWQDISSDITKIEKIYTYEDCGSVIGSKSSDEKNPTNSNNYSYDPTRQGAYCELCSPSGSCFPEPNSLYNQSWPFVTLTNTNSWIDRNTLVNRVPYGDATTSAVFYYGLNPQCCSRVIYNPSNGVVSHTASSSFNGMRSAACGSGLVEEYECVSSYKTSKCIDGDVTTKNVKLNAGLCGQNICTTDIISKIPQDKNIDDVKVQYKIKQNKTIEQTITTLNKAQKRSVTTPCPQLPDFVNFGYVDYSQGCTQLGFQESNPNGQRGIITYKTKYIEPKTLGNYKITVTFAYCKGTSRSC